jgi:hypothetical protein
MVVAQRLFFFSRWVDPARQVGRLAEQAVVRDRRSSSLILIASAA